MDFRDQIEEQLQPLSREQICFFAWLCGLRALPFLSEKRGFSYWPEAARQKHLHSVFYALDIGAAWGGGIYITDAAYAAADANAARADAKAAYAKAAYTAAKAAADADAARADAKAVYAAAKAADAADTAAKAADDARAAAYTADAYAYAAAYDVDAYKVFEKNIFRDIEVIKNSNLTALNNDTSIYGKTWPNFLKDLNDAGCGYWAKLYEDLFASRFDIDFGKLERRLNVPDEIRAEGAAAVGQYLERLGQDIETLNEARIIILGEKGAGKTSLARKLFDINADLPEEDESTEGVETSIWSFPDKDSNKSVHAHIWDFAGHSITHSAHRCFMSARCLYIYVYNGRIERDNDPVYWLEQIRIHGGDSPVLFLVNEKDDHRAKIAEKTLKNSYPAIAGYYRVNIGSKNTTELEKFRQTVMDTVRDNPAWNSQIISAAAYRIKNELRECFDKTKTPHIMREEFDAIAEKNGASNEHVKDILADLHALGICLWYDKVEMQDFNMLVLNPDWITNGIYRVINRGFNENRHILTVTDGVKMLKHDKRYKYPLDKVKYLFELMRLYELAFFNDANRIFIPGILSEDMADGLQTFDNADDRLTMIFNVDKVLPPNIVARVIVRRSEFGEIFNEGLLWSKGAALKYRDGDATALIVEDMRSVTVRVKGLDKTAYIASLRETLKDIFESYKAIKPDLLYEVLVPQSQEYKKNELPVPREKEAPLMLKEEVISGCIRAARQYFDAPNQRDIPLDRTEQAYAIHNHLNVFFGTVENVTMQNNNSLTNDLSAHTTISFEIKDCVINLQSELNSLARDLRDENFSDDAKYMEKIAAAFEEAQKTIDITPEAAVAETLKKKGLVSTIKGFYDEITDENSELHKNTAKLRNGAKKLQKAGRVYNDFVRLLPGLKAALPEIPETWLTLGK